MNIFKYMSKNLNWFQKLITPNTGYSSKSLFLVVVTLIGMLLLIMPIVILSIEIWYNHTIQTNLADMAAYIGACAALFGAGGMSKAFAEKHEHRLAGPDGKIGTDDDIYVKMSDEDYAAYVMSLEKKKKEEEEVIERVPDTEYI